MKVTTCELDNGSSSGASLPKANIFPSFWVLRYVHGLSSQK
jgi:hypothetical protein